MLAFLLMLTDARADQCAWIPKTTAEAALKYLQPGTLWATYCEPCGDKRPELKTAAQKAEVRQTSSPEHWEVVVDGTAVDLAYVFVAQRPDGPRLSNLSFLVSCPATDVSRTIPRPAR